MNAARADLHVHSSHSNKPSIWAMRRINCPESFTAPEQVYAAARARGMDFVTITDHNTITGALQIAHLPGAFVSAEITSRFPESGAKLHVVALGIDESGFAEALRLRRDVYDLVGFLRARDIAHFVAHPLYDMDGRLGADAVERMLLLFDVIEVRNGSRAERYNALVQELVSSLTPERYQRLRERHGDRPDWSPRWDKSVVGGSDDHSGFFVARAHTSVPAAAGPAQFLRAVREGRSRAEGEGGNALTLAHTIYGIGLRYYTERVAQRRTRSLPFTGLLLDRCFHADRRLTAFEKLRFFARRSLQDLVGDDREGSFERLLDREARRVLSEPGLLAGIPPADRDRRIFTVTSLLANRMIYHYTARLLAAPRREGIAPLLQSIGTLAAIHGLTLPYYLGFYHQHRSKPLLRELRRRAALPATRREERIALFTDTLDEINGVAMTIRRLSATARARGVGLTVLTTKRGGEEPTPGVRAFPSVGEVDLPEYPELRLRFPPILDVLDFVERGGFTRVHVSTPGTMGLLGIAVAKLMDLPVAGTYHTDIPQYVGSLTNDAFLENTAWGYILWFYSLMDEVLVPSRATRDQLVERGLDPAKIRPLPRWVDTAAFTPARRQAGFWARRGLAGGTTFLYVGRVSREKNLALLAAAFRRLVEAGGEARLAVVGDGPYRADCEDALRGLPAVFTGYLHGEELAAAYASADVFVFPSATDTFGNVVLEAQAAGLPVIVSDQGGPRELMLDGATGLVVRANDAGALHDGMRRFLADAALGPAMGERARRFVETNAPRAEDVYGTILNTPSPDACPVPC